jgi:hypothetical protein
MGDAEPLFHSAGFVAFVGVTIACSIAPLAGILLIVFALLALIVSDISTRDARAGTTACVRSISGLRENYVWWKLGSSCLLSFLLCTVPLIRTIAHGPPALAALVGGIVFVASTATALGVTTANPMLDFAGFYGHATTATMFLYAALSVAAIVFAQLLYRARLART